MTTDSESWLAAADLIREAAIRELEAVTEELGRVSAELAEARSQLSERSAELDALRARKSVRIADSLARLARGGR